MSRSTIRTFLGFQLPPALHSPVAEWQRHAGQSGRAVDLAMLHLTLCVVGETDQHDLFLARRVIAALAGDLPPAALIRLGRIDCRALGAEWVTRGWTSEIREFFDTIAAMLMVHGIAPLHRASGLRPHVTLGYDLCAFEPFAAIRHWIPDELLLIESRWDDALNKRTHDVLHRWRLLPPAQSAFAFMAEEPAAPPPIPPLLRAA